MHADILQDTLIAMEREYLTGAIVTHMVRWHRSKDSADMTTAMAFLDELVATEDAVPK